jgi:2-methylcitrate dehydratase
MAAEHIEAGDIARIRVEIAPSGRGIVDDRSDPPINLQYVLAVAAFDKVVGVVQTHSPSRLEDPEVINLQRRIELRDNEEFEKVWPGRRPAMVEVETTAGALHSVLVEYPRGSPDRPLTWDEVNDKFANLCMDWDGSDRVAERIRELEDVRDLSELLDPLKRTAS